MYICLRNSETFASELLENLEEVFPRYTYIVICLACSNVQQPC